MTSEDMLKQRQILNDALKESFKKMIEQKKRLGQEVVTIDKDRNVIIVSAEEAERMAGLV